MEKKTKKEMWTSLLEIEDVAKDENLVAFIKKEIESIDETIDNWIQQSIGLKG